MATAPELHGLAPRSVAVAVSGGVDSLYTLIRLHEQGLAACAIYGRFLDITSKDPVPLLESHCAALGLPLHVVDVRQEFYRAVIEPFCAEYARCATPNPCVWCNARIKFGVLLHAAQEHGAPTLATGHYVRRVEHPRYGTVLRRGDDSSKDQSYFLAMVPRERLHQAVFPLAGERKKNIVEIIAKKGLAVPSPGESQEICFVPDDAYRPFLQTLGVTLPGPGAVTLRDGQKVGTHGGLWQYTEGQRRGLGIAWKEPLYVLEKQCATNTLIVGEKDTLTVTGCNGQGVNLLVPVNEWPEELFVQVRYRQRAVRADVVVNGEHMRASFIEAQGPAAPGQLLAVYDGDGYLLAGARIVENIR